MAFLDSDDYWEPEFLREQLALFATDPSLDVVYSDAWICGESPLAGRRFMDLSPSRGAVTVASLLTCECTVITSAVVARTDIVRAAGGFNAGLRRGQDFDLWLRLARNGAHFGYQRNPLVHRRLHSRNSVGRSDRGASTRDQCPHSGRVEGPASRRGEARRRAARVSPGRAGACAGETGDRAWRVRRGAGTPRRGGCAEPWMEAEGGAPRHQNSAPSPATRM